MEFWGLIYNKKFARRGIFKSKEYDEYSINSPDLKKYYVNGKWIMSTSYEYLKTIDIRKYIRKSESIGKILFSSELGMLKFDYIEKGFFKKQLVIEKKIVKSNIGFEHLDIKSKSLTQIFNEIIWEHFRLNIELIEPNDSFFRTLKSAPFKASKRDMFFDIYIILNLPRSIITLITIPVISYYLILVLIDIISNRELFTISNFFLFLVALIVSLILPIYLIRLAYKELKNYLRIKYKVLNDKILTMPNNTSA